MNLNYGRDAAPGVGDLDAESLGLGDDFDALAGRDGVADPNHPSICESVNMRTQLQHTRQRTCGCASGAVQHRWGSGRGTPCGPKASCGGSSCWNRIQSKPIQILVNSCSNPPPPETRQDHRTEGMAACPLNRLLTRLSIPLGFLHAASTHL